MSCGNLFLQDPSNRFWILSAANSGVLINSHTSLIISPYTAPVLNSPSFSWQLSADLDGTIAATVIGSISAPTSVVLSSTTARSFQLSIDDTGILWTTSQGVLPVVSVPYPTNVSMSQWPPLGLTSSLAGATPLTVSADFSIWSCTLGRFINEDTTNIIVVLSE
jgi:hypothetical protein